MKQMESNMNEEIAKKNKAKKMLLYFGILSIVMLFAGLTSAYIISRTSTFWVDINLPYGFYWSTITLLISSFTIWKALQAAKKNQIQQIKLWVAATLVLGITFGIHQFKAWGQLIEKGNYVVSNIMDLKGEHGIDYTFYYNGEPMQYVDGEFYAASDNYQETPLTDRLMGNRNTASSYIYVLSAVHFVHLFGGFIYLLFVLRGALKERFNPNNTLKLELCGTYWHFLDGLWIYLFLFLLFIH